MHSDNHHCLRVSTICLSWNLVSIYTAGYVENCLAVLMGNKISTRLYDLWATNRTDVAGAVINTSSNDFSSQWWHWASRIYGVLTMKAHCRQCERKRPIDEEQRFDYIPFRWPKQPDLSTRDLGNILWNPLQSRTSCSSVIRYSYSW